MTWMAGQTRITDSGQVCPVAASPARGPCIFTAEHREVLTKVVT